jgi:hypothetical protein
LANNQGAAFESRKQGYDGESPNRHFTDAAQKLQMAATIGSRKSDQDALTFPGDPGDD